MFAAENAPRRECCVYNANTVWLFVQEGGKESASGLGVFLVWKNKARTRAVLLRSGFAYSDFLIFLLAAAVQKRGGGVLFFFCRSCSVGAVRAERRENAAWEEPSKVELQRGEGEKWNCWWSGAWGSARGRCPRIALPRSVADGAVHASCGRNDRGKMRPARSDYGCDE